MFESLRKKISSWVSSPEKEDKKPSKSSKKSTKTKKKSSKGKKAKKESKKQDSDTLQEKVQKSQLKKIEAPKPEEATETEETSLKEKIELKEEFSEEEQKGFFSKLKQRISSHPLTEEQFEEIFYELELTLLENNVALEVVDKIKESLSKELVGKSVKSSEAEKTILEALKNSIDSVLIEPPDLIKKIKESQKPYVILFFGINGSGKTTSISKLAHKLKKGGISSVLAAGDTFRAASIEQLQKHADNLSLPLIKSQYGADPASVAFDAISYAKKHGAKVVLIDTAGRMYTASNLLREMEKIVRVSSPDLKIFVGESITGNDATEQAKTFNESIGIDGIILTKADIDEKAGAILSVSYVTQKPIYFLGTGQEYKDLTPFSKEIVFKNIGLEKIKSRP